MVKTWSRVLAAAAAAEATTGLVVLVWPSDFVRLLFGQDLAGLGVVMSRLAGAALIGLGIACWPRNGGSDQAYGGMLAYSVLATLLLASTGAAGQTGVLVWPAVGAHLLLAAALAVAWFKVRGALRT